MCWWPTPTTHNRNGNAGKPFDSKPKCVDGPRQQLTTRWMLMECQLLAKPCVLMTHANNSQQERKWGNAHWKQTQVCSWPTITTHHGVEVAGVPIASKPKCVDGPHQQLTTGTERRECLLKANPNVLKTHANNWPQERKCGNAYWKQTQVCWWTTPTTHNRNGNAGMPIESKRKCVDGPRQQLTTGTEVRQCLLKANPGLLLTHANN